MNGVVEEWNVAIMTVGMMEWWFSLPSIPTFHYSSSPAFQ
jgi:hypothetical protein